MGHRTDRPGSGTLAADEYRDSMGQKAAGILSAACSARCVSGDHAGSELCTETIVRLSGNTAKTAGSDATLNSTIQAAVLNLRAGLGVHKVAADHSGGNTCMAVIVGAV